VQGQLEVAGAGSLAIATALAAPPFKLKTGQAQNQKVIYSGRGG
jgi:hypothetical protein